MRSVLLSADPVEDVSQVSERIDLESFARDDDTGQYGCTMSSFVAPEEEP